MDTGTNILTPADLGLINDRVDELTPIARGALATYLLMAVDEMSTADLQRKLGYRTGNGVRYNLVNVSLVVPVYQPREGYWAITRKGDQQEIG